MDTHSSNTTWITGKSLCILSAVTYGVAPAFIDTLDPHHLTSPDWPPHARLHLLWQISTAFFLALLSIHFFWKATPRAPGPLRSGVLVGMAHLAGFFTAASLKGVAGAAFDADGRVILGFLPPAALHFSTSTALLLAGFALCRRAASGAVAGLPAPATDGPAGDGQKESGNEHP